MTCHNLKTKQRSLKQYVKNTNKTKSKFKERKQNEERLRTRAFKENFCNVKNEVL